LLVAGVFSVSRPPKRSARSTSAMDLTKTSVVVPARSLAVTEPTAARPMLPSTSRSGTVSARTQTTSTIVKPELRCDDVIARLPT
jgi:hypothetical protein